MPNPSDPIWGVIGVVATVVFGVASVIGVMLTFLQLAQTRKSLSYELQSITPVLSIAEGFQDKFEIRFNGQPVRNLHLLIVRFVNSGRTSIRPEDFARKLKITLKSGEVISASISNAEPRNLGAAVDAHDKTTVFFNRILLNSKDEFTAGILMSDFSGNRNDVQVEARIEGVSKVAELRESALSRLIKESQSPLLSSLALAIPFGSVFLLGLDFLVGLRNKKSVDKMDGA